MKPIFIVAVIGLFLSSVSCAKPIICMHGADGSFNDFLNFTNYLGSGRQVLSLDINNDIESNKAMEQQVRETVLLFKKIHANPLFANGYHILAHGQGAVIMRCAIERMDDHKVDSFVTIAGVNPGYYGVQNLPTYLFENLNDESANMSASFENTQKVSGPLNLWRDMNYESYLRNNKFLPYCNNERGYEFNPKYAQNFYRVKNFVMFGSPQDGKLVPWYQSVFDHMGAGGVRVTMEQSPYYTPSFAATLLAAALPTEPTQQLAAMQQLTAVSEQKKLSIQRTSFTVPGIGKVVGGHRANFFAIPPPPAPESIVYPEVSPFDRNPPTSKPADPPKTRGFGLYEMSQEFRVFSYEVENVRYDDWLSKSVLFPVIVNFGQLK